MSASLVHKSLQVLKGENNLSKEPKSKNIKKKRKKNKQIADNTKKITLADIQSTTTNSKDKFEDNLKKLQLLSSRKLDSETAEKVFERAVKNTKFVEETQPEPEGTVFTEEDFINFEKEYFCS
ncbi:active regulator of SIRT1-like [Ctenocephalides felis]|uniref:active regulator of SIRT1-like n=1 Tax=Ctenocephalides felis TaxID=7515 RepID=UPI000E6E5B94|nr:active regulator of SIRT1-like [Ctenocephalides felis]XP_026465555.1 active regulator of SIRT1-like [Ctenocephalides felis]XP_026465572.1 active regulator of SIRT1-like [Ctenocephalides felis]XP_026465573.1 active regulator of SIRT1-like [Ctenocephalides felis]